ncbi:hypothetical protein ACFLQ5_01615 [Bacteroidota bacterium]
MKKITKLFFTIIIITTIMFSACDPDDEDPILNTSDYYVGTWLAEETSTLYPDPITFTVEIKADAITEGQVFIYNFYHLGNADADKVTAITSSSSITISPQTVCNNVINGEGTLSGNKIMWSYYVNDGADIDHVISTYTKQ